MMEPEKEFDKYAYYRQSVQAPEDDVVFFKRVGEELAQRPVTVLREDFSGGFALSCEWIKLSPNHFAHAVDLDPEPLEYGRQNYLSVLSPTQKQRLKTWNSDVRSPELPQADLIAAMNFSHYIFKTRKALGEYYRNCWQTLEPGGVFLLDCFGGSQCQGAIEEETPHRDKGFSYFWDQEGFDPITHHATFRIHFRERRKQKQINCFTYDWRMWTIPEIRELLEEVGFSSSHVYWEGTTESGEGDGEFSIAEVGESCESWIAYIAAVKT